MHEKLFSLLTMIIDFALMHYVVCKVATRHKITIVWSMWTVKENDLKVLASAGYSVRIVFCPVEHKGRLPESNDEPLAYEMFIEHEGTNKAVLLTAQNKRRRFRNLSKGMALVERIFPNIENVRVLTKVGAADYDQGK